MSVQDAAEEEGVCVGTVFRWRHRFLEAAVAYQPREVAVLLEVDETYFPYSEKGQRCLGRKAKKRSSGKGIGQVVAPPRPDGWGRPKAEFLRLTAGLALQSAGQ